MTFNADAEFGKCHTADECVMDTECLLFDNCKVTEEEMADG